MEAEPAAPKFPRRRFALRITTALGAGLLCFACLALPVLPGPAFLMPVGWTLQSAGVLFVFPFLIAAALVPISCVALLAPTTRAWGLRTLLPALVWTLAILTALFGGQALRRARFEATAGRMEPLIRAIESHRAATGSDPESLEALVPARLPALPSTGLMAYPDVTYRRRDSGDDSFIRYQLMIPCSSGGINFDVFVFWPEGNYPDFLYGGGVERIGRWAYVHE